MVILSGEMLKFILIMCIVWKLLPKLTGTNFLRRVSVLRSVPVAILHTAFYFGVWWYVLQTRPKVQASSFSVTALSIFVLILYWKQLMLHGSRKKKPHTNTYQDMNMTEFKPAIWLTIGGQTRQTIQLPPIRQTDWRFNLTNESCNICHPKKCILYPAIANSLNLPSIPIPLDPSC